MKHIKFLIVLCVGVFCLGLSSNLTNVSANENTNITISNYNVPTKIYRTFSQSAALRSHLPKSMFKSVYYNGYYYSGTVYLTGTSGSSANDGVTGYYGGYLYGGYATTSKIMFEK